MKVLATATLSLLSVLGPLATAGPTGYDCTVSTELHLDHGELKTFPRPLELGKRFSVHRASGLLVESSPSFWSPRDATTTVLAHGNFQNSFIATYVAPSGGGGVHATTLRIEEFAPSDEKPFLLVSGGGVYAGICK